MRFIIIIAYAHLTSTYLTNQLITNWVPNKNETHAAVCRPTPALVTALTITTMMVSVAWKSAEATMGRRRKRTTDSLTSRTPPLQRVGENEWWEVLFYLLPTVLNVPKMWEQYIFRLWFESSFVTIPRLSESQDCLVNHRYFNRRCAIYRGIYM